ncbi:MAG: glycosyltransferase family 92 protein [Bacteroidales bacterium]|nr:glycosyltransferase family 92 protein [Bacteroidales bacterium]
MSFLKNLSRRQVKDGIHVAFDNCVTRFFLWRRPSYGKRYAISLCAIFKNEAPFLREWIEYHHMVGVDHFYLYNNNSEDGFRDVLQPYQERGWVTLMDWPHNQDQMGAYRHFYENCRDQTQWACFLDIDEFIVPRYHTDLHDWIRTMDRFPVIVVYWQMFGTSGRLRHDYSRYVIEQYTVSWDRLYHVGKCFFNTDYDIARFDATTHHLTSVLVPVAGTSLRRRIGPVDPSRRFVKAARPGGSQLGSEREYRRKTIQINHYWSKAWDVYEMKRQMTDVYFKENPKKDLAYFYRHEHNNRAADRVIFRFLMQLKLTAGENAQGNE